MSVAASLAIRRIADPDRHAWYNAQISALAAARVRNAAILARGDEDLLLAAAKAVIHRTIEQNYGDILEWKEATTDENRAEQERRIKLTRREIQELQTKRKALEE